MKRALFGPLALGSEAVSDRLRTIGLFALTAPFVWLGASEDGPG